LCFICIGGAVRFIALWLLLLYTGQVWFPGGFPEFLKDPTACRLDLNAVKGFAIDEPYLKLNNKCRNEWLKVTNCAEPLIQAHTFGISIQTTGVFGSRYPNVASIG
jgi:hypothetical protein